MFRRCVVVKCEILLDLKFGSQLLVKFMNYVMVDGKKFVVEYIVYGVLDIVVDCKNGEFLELFEKVFDNICLMVEVKSCWVGGVIYQVLVEVCFSCCIVLVMCWLVDFVCKCGEKSMVQCFVGEVVDVVEGKGVVMKKCEDVYCMVEVNKVFFYFCF